ncbi:hypothetical protein EVAR_93130_1 [Eumeta japonica]|uniref:Biogenesis of lysosome-related organelles complex 1 subunit 5 n=1 Tax=Eumeta variegata TaxID=151549 RepID=A0A4C1TFC1_EUMVA|nr:hypothetical protein EVAR_93130_1 [Eumeta japonica]
MSELSRGKRGDSEVENLFSILEKVTDIKVTQLDKIKKSGEISLSAVSDKLTIALSLSEDIKTQYSEIQKINQEKLVENRRKRQIEWDQFIDDMNFKCKRIDNAFEEKEEELRDFYADLNHKLNITK